MHEELLEQRLVLDAPHPYSRLVTTLPGDQVPPVRREPDGGDRLPGGVEDVGLLVLLRVVQHYRAPEENERGVSVRLSAKGVAI